MPRTRGRRLYATSGQMLSISAARRVLGQRPHLRLRSQSASTSYLSPTPVSSPLTFTFFRSTLWSNCSIRLLTLRFRQVDARSPAVEPRYIYNTHDIHVHKIRPRSQVPSVLVFVRFFAQWSSLLSEICIYTSSVGVRGDVRSEPRVVRTKRKILVCYSIFAATAELNVFSPLRTASASWM